MFFCNLPFTATRCCNSFTWISNVIIFSSFSLASVLLKKKRKEKGPLVIQLKYCPVLPSLYKVDYYYYYWILYNIWEILYKFLFPLEGQFPRVLNFRGTVTIKEILFQTSEVVHCMFFCWVIINVDNATYLLQKPTVVILNF